jgi:hypothetical protein
VAGINNTGFLVVAVGAFQGSGLQNVTVVPINLYVGEKADIPHNAPYMGVATAFIPVFGGCVGHYNMGVLSRQAQFLSQDLKI